MTPEDVKNTAFAMPLTSPSYPRGPYRFVNREYLIISYETDMDALRAVVPEPLEIINPIVKYEFIRMPDSTGFGNYTESGQVIPVAFEGRKGAYVHSMYLDDDAPINGGREIWGFPKKLGQPKLESRKETLVGTLEMDGERVATGTMGFKHKALDLDEVKKSMEEPGFLLKIVPHVDCTPRICELVRYHLEDITVKGAWTGPAALELHPHALAPCAQLPVKRVLGASHILSDLTLGLGEVVHDYMAP
ncbi:acetoacetate decarboxylase [Paracoccaceae bacterium GXU_MW_L88]